MGLFFLGEEEGKVWLAPMRKTLQYDWVVFGRFYSVTPYPDITLIFFTSNFKI